MRFFVVFSVVLKFVTHFAMRYRVGQKNQTCLSVDNSAMVTRRKSWYVKSFSML